MPRKRDRAITPCRRETAVEQAVDSYAAELKKHAASIGNHGLPEREFWRSGLFRGAIEKIRGEQAASMAEKRAFVADVLDWMQSEGRITSWIAAGGTDRHDYEVTLAGGTICGVEAKGCLDGNNTNIFQRPRNADEFVIWSLCQNPGADPRHNAWSGIHTRLSAEIVHGGEVVDGLIIWDDLCGSIGRPCPRTSENESRLTRIGERFVPPPCIYLFPRTVPDPRNNIKPKVHKLEQVKFLKALHDAFQCLAEDVTEVEIEAGLVGTSTARRTRLIRNGQVVAESAMTAIKRAK